MRGRRAHEAGSGVNTAGCLLFCNAFVTVCSVVYPVQAGEEGRCGDRVIRSFKVSLSYISKV